jgi:hypothetical protein
LADRLRARPIYRGDFSYDLGDLLPPVIGQHGDLLAQAAKAANSWNDNDARAKVGALKEARKEALCNWGGEEWVINKAIHYNDWASFAKTEFRDVVAAFKELLQLFRCSRKECGSWLEVEPRKGNAGALRCDCMAVNLNLKEK